MPASTGITCFLIFSLLTWMPPLYRHLSNYVGQRNTITGLQLVNCSDCRKIVKKTVRCSVWRLMLWSVKSSKGRSQLTRYNRVQTKKLLRRCKLLPTLELGRNADGTVRVAAVDAVLYEICCKIKQGNHRLHFTRAVHPVTLFPLTGDAAYRQHVGGGPSHGHRQHAQKMW